MNFAYLRVSLLMRWRKGEVLTRRHVKDFAFKIFHHFDFELVAGEERETAKGKTYCFIRHGRVLEQH